MCKWLNSSTNTKYNENRQIDKTSNGLKSVVTKWLVPTVPGIEIPGYNMNRAYGTLRKKAACSPVGTIHIVATDFNPLYTVV